MLQEITGTQTSNIDATVTVRFTETGTFTSNIIKSRSLDNWTATSFLRDFASSVIPDVGTAPWHFFGHVAHVGFRPDGGFKLDPNMS